MTFENAANLVSKITSNELSSVTNTISEIDEMLKEETRSASDISKIIDKDMTLSARLLKVANSPIYNSNIKKVDNSRDAVVRVGYSNIKEVLLSTIVSDLFKGDKQICDFSISKLWNASRAVALVNKRIYTDLLKSNNTYPYLAGLLHNIGIAIAYQYQNANFKRAIQNRYSKQNSLPLEEEKSMKMTHEEIGKALAIKWNLGDNLQFIMGNHHSLKSNASHNQRQLFFATKMSQYMCIKNMSNDIYVDFLVYPDNNVSKETKSKYINKRIQFYAKRLFLKEGEIKVFEIKTYIELNKMKASPGWL